MQESTAAQAQLPDVGHSGWQLSPSRNEAGRPAGASAAASLSPDATVAKVGALSAGPDAGARDAREPRRDVTFPQSYARFEINQKTQRISIKIVDAATDEVIREIPSEEVQRIAEDLQALARRGIGGKRPVAAAERAAGGGVDRYV